MTKLIITQGLPGSGKTTWARKQKAWRVNRDDLRAMVLPTWPHGDNLHELLLTDIQHNTVGTLLHFGLDVIVDDTNLRPDVVETLKLIADTHGAEFHIEDFTDVPLETCIERDAARANPGRRGRHPGHARAVLGACIRRGASGAG